MLSSRTTSAVKKFHKKNAKLLKELRDLTIRVVDEMASSSSGAPQCCYCIKMYREPKYLMSHIMRRHPEELLNLHDQMSRQEQPPHHKPHHKKGTIPLDSAKELEVVLAKLKSEMVTLLKKCERQRHSFKNQSNHTSENDSVHSETLRHRHKKDALFQRLQSECKNSEKAVRDLEKRYAHLTEVVNQNGFLKEHLAQNEQMLKELYHCREEIATLSKKVDKKLAHFESSVHQELQQQNEEWESKAKHNDKKYLANVKQLCVEFESKLNKISKEQNSDIEAKFERHLQQYMERCSLLALKPPKRRVKSVPKNHTTPKTIVKPVVKSKPEKHKPLNIDSIHEKNRLLVEDRLKKHGLSSKAANLTLRDIEKKSKEIQNETKFLQMKYEDYHDVRQDLEKQVDYKVNSSFIEKVQKKKISFAPTVDEQLLASKVKMPPVQQVQPTAQCSYEFINSSNTNQQAFINEDYELRKKPSVMKEQPCFDEQHSQINFVSSTEASFVLGSDSSSRTETPESSSFVKEMEAMSRSLFRKAAKTQNPPVVASTPKQKSLTLKSKGIEAPFQVAMTSPIQMNEVPNPSQLDMTYQMEATSPIQMDVAGPSGIEEMPSSENQNATNLNESVSSLESINSWDDEKDFG